MTMRPPSLIAALAGALLLLAAPAAGAQEPDFAELLRRIDERSTFEDDLSATMRLESSDPEEGDETLQVRIFRRDSGDMFLLLIERPESQLGQGYLNVEDGLWFYDPESRQFTYTSLSESFEGSDANNDDFGASDLAGDYEVVASEEGTLGSYDVWILDLEAVNDEVTYPAKRIWVTRDDGLLLKSEDYSLAGRLLRTSYFPSYVRAGDSFIANEMIFVDALVEGRVTRVTLSDVSTADIPDSVFTKAYVERVNR